MGVGGELVGGDLDGSGEGLEAEEACQEAEQGFVAAHQESGG